MWPYPVKPGLPESTIGAARDRPGADRGPHRPEIGSPAPALDRLTQRAASQQETHHAHERTRRSGQRREGRVVAEEAGQNHQHGQPDRHDEQRRDGHRTGGTTHRQTCARAQHQHQGREDDPGQQEDSDHWGEITYPASWRDRPARCSRRLRMLCPVAAGES